MKDENYKSIFAKTKYRYYYELLIPALISLFGGYYFWKKVLSPLYFGAIPNCMLIAALFFAITFVFSGGCGVIERLMVRIRPENDKLGYKYIFVFSLVSALVIGLISGILEFIYEFQPRKTIINPPDEIIYVIDDSGSMYGNDPNDIRLNSVVEINDRLKNGTKVGLVRFSDEINTNISLHILDDKYKNEINSNMQKGTGGGTDIGQALKVAIEQYKSENNSLIESNRRILLITDGEATVPVDEKEIINQCKSLGVSIDVISLGSSTDMFFLRRITRNTGGNLAKSPSDYYINAAYSIMIGDNVKRCMLVPVILIDDYRIVLAFMQILFMSIIGILIGFVVVVLLRYRPFINRQIKHLPKLVLIGSVILTISDAGFFSIFILLLLLLVPLYDARVKEKEIRIPKIKLPSIWGFIDTCGMVDCNASISSDVLIDKAGMVDKNKYL